MNTKNNIVEIEFNKPTIDVVTKAKTIDKGTSAAFDGKK
jgi:hypothetical protein